MQTYNPLVYAIESAHTPLNVDFLAPESVRKFYLLFHAKLHTIFIECHEHIGEIAVYVDVAIFAFVLANRLHTIYYLIQMHQRFE